MEFNLYNWYVGIVGISLLIPIICGLIGIIGDALLSLIPFFMARKQGRSGLLWFGISFILSLPVAVVILLVLGVIDERKRKKLQALNDNNQINQSTKQTQHVQQHQETKDQEVVQNVPETENQSTVK